MKVYLSLPVMGRNINEVRRHSDLVKAALSRRGHEVVSPLDVYCGDNPAYEDSLCYGLRVMMDCDSVCFCDGWEQSCECRIEHDVAMRFKAHGKKDFKIMYED